MVRVPVQSSNVKSVGYDSHTSVLEIEFLGGGLYRYGKVPPVVYEQFLLSKSKGKFFKANVKDFFATSKVIPK